MDSVSEICKHAWVENAVWPRPYGRCGRCHTNFASATPTFCPLSRHVHGSQKWIPGSDPKDLDLGSYWIIDPEFQVCREIQWDHRS